MIVRDAVTVFIPLKDLAPSLSRCVDRSGWDLTVTLIGSIHLPRLSPRPDTAVFQSTLVLTKPEMKNKTKKKIENRHDDGPELTVSLGGANRPTDGL